MSHDELSKQPIISKPRPFQDERDSLLYLVDNFVINDLLSHFSLTARGWTKKGIYNELLRLKKEEQKPTVSLFHVLELFYNNNGQLLHSSTLEAIFKFIFNRHNRTVKVHYLENNELMSLDNLIPKYTHIYRFALAIGHLGLNELVYYLQQLFLINSIENHTTNSLEKSSLNLNLYGLLQHVIDYYPDLLGFLPLTNLNLNMPYYNKHANSVHHLLKSKTTINSNHFLTLINAGGKCDKVDTNGNTVLHLLANQIQSSHPKFSFTKAGQYSQLIKIAIKAGADVNILNHQKQSAYSLSKKAHQKLNCLKPCQPIPHQRPPLSQGIFSGSESSTRGTLYKDNALALHQVL